MLRQHALALKKLAATTRTEQFAIVLFVVLTTAGQPTCGSELYSFEGGFVEALSADGSTVAGVFSDGPALWHPLTGDVTLLPNESPDYFHISNTSGISANGSVVVGRTFGDQGFEAFRWTAETGLVQLGRPEGFESSATDVSADGKIIFGTLTDSSTNVTTAMRWTEADGMTNLGLGPDNREISGPITASADGQFFSGNSWSDNRLTDPNTAVRWSESTGMVSLGGLPGKPDSQAWDISGDGSTVVGWTAVDQSNVGAEPFRWTQEAGMLGLGVLPGWDIGAAELVSHDGSLILGAVRPLDRSNRSLFAWTDASGNVDLEEILLAEVGVSFGTSAYITGMSADNRTLAGRGEFSLGDESHSGAWVVVLDEPLQDLLIVPEPTALAVMLVAGPLMLIGRRIRSKIATNR